MELIEKELEDGTVVLLRKNTTDENCFKEVVEQKCYQHNRFGMMACEGERWLDLGGNIGAFAMYCYNKGAHCVSYEPDQENFLLLKQNLGFLGDIFECHNFAVTTSKSKTLNFYKGSKSTDKYRYTIKPNSHPYKTLPNMWVGDITEKFHGIKMDIEGSELDIIDSEFLLKQCDKLVLEYHFTKDRSMANFHNRISILKKHFDEVYYMPSLDKFPKNGQYPGFFDRIIYAKNKK